MKTKQHSEPSRHGNHPRLLFLHLYPSQALLLSFKLLHKMYHTCYKVCCRSSVLFLCAPLLFSKERTRTNTSSTSWPLGKAVIQVQPPWPLPPQGRGRMVSRGSNGKAQGVTICVAPQAKAGLECEVPRQGISSQLMLGKDLRSVQVSSHGAQ
jgi:hypothetical protein